MKFLIKALIVFIVWILLSYLFAAFYYYQIDPSKWSLEGRSIMVFFGGVIGVVAGVLTYFISKNE